MRVKRFPFQLDAIEYAQQRNRELQPAWNNRWGVFAEDLGLGDASKRFYAATPGMMWVYCMTRLDLRPHQQYLYEVILLETPCHLYWDFEFYYRSNPTLSDALHVELVAMFRTFIAKCYPDIHLDIEVLTSASVDKARKKCSVHDVIKLYRVLDPGGGGDDDDNNGGGGGGGGDRVPLVWTNNFHAGALMRRFERMVINEHGPINKNRYFVWPERHHECIEEPDKYKCNCVLLFSIDMGVYTKHRNLRMLHSAKRKGEWRPLRWVLNQDAPAHRESLAPELHTDDSGQLPREQLQRWMAMQVMRVPDGSESLACRELSVYDNPFNVGDGSECGSIGGNRHWWTEADNEASGFYRNKRRKTKHRPLGSTLDRPSKRVRAAPRRDEHILKDMPSVMQQVIEKVKHWWNTTWAPKAVVPRGQSSRAALLKVRDRAVRWKGRYMTIQTSTPYCLRKGMAVTRDERMEPHWHSNMIRLELNFYSMTLLQTCYSDTERECAMDDKKEHRDINAKYQFPLAPILGDDLALQVKTLAVGQALAARWRSDPAPEPTPDPAPDLDVGDLGGGDPVVALDSASGSRWSLFSSDSSRWTRSTDEPTASTPTNTLRISGDDPGAMPWPARLVLTTDPVCERDTTT